MAAPTFPYAFRSEYERVDAASVDVRHEWHDGTIVAMAGASVGHVLIQSNLTSFLGGRLLGRPCRVMGSDVRIETTNLTAYPDAILTCPRPEFVPGKAIATVGNPAVIFEILSPSTERVDRGLKFQAYQTLATLTDYVLISQSHAAVEHYHRIAEDRWLLTFLHRETDVLQLTDYGLEIPISELYTDVEFPSVPTESPEESGPSA